VSHEIRIINAAQSAVEAAQRLRLAVNEATAGERARVYIDVCSAVIVLRQVALDCAPKGTDDGGKI
jgi:hypothetical protein